jgi:hypothetical protein
LGTVRDHHFPKATKLTNTRLITEEIEYDPNDPIEPKSVKPDMKRYVAALAKTTKRI